MTEPFLSGESGLIVGPRRRTRAAFEELACGIGLSLMRANQRLDALAASAPGRRVLVCSAYRAGSDLPAAVRELQRSRHELGFALGALGDADPALGRETSVADLSGGKFPNLNSAISRSGERPVDFDWLLIVDDDVRLPARFLDRFIALIESFSLQLAQPAQTRRSHAAWSVTRRHALSLLRRTEFVEIGPVTAISRVAAAELVPFPELRFGWGLDAYWASLAARHSWRLGIADGTPVRHERRGVASGYDPREAIEEARAFTAGARLLPRSRLQATLSKHRSVG